MSTSFPPELIEQMDKGRVALFLGADLPQSITGLLSRADLARGLARRHSLDESLSLAEVAQRVGQAGNRWAFTDFIRNALDTAGKGPQPFHQRIAVLVKEHHVETLITTAYDNLLELAFQQAGLLSFAWPMLHQKTGHHFSGTPNCFSKHPRQLVNGMNAWQNGLKHQFKTLKWFGKNFFLQLTTMMS